MGMSSARLLIHSYPGENVRCGEMNGLCWYALTAKAAPDTGSYSGTAQTLPEEKTPVEGRMLKGWFRGLSSPEEGR